MAKPRQATDLLLISAHEHIQDDLDRAQTLVTMDEERRILHDAWIRVQDNVVVAVGEGTPQVETGEESRDLGGAVVVPGLVNAHHHLCQNLTRAYGPAADAKLFDWLKALYPVWAGYDLENVGLAARVGFAELMLSGCTTTSDHHYLIPRDGPADLLDAAIDAAIDMGMRFHVTRGSMSVGESAGGLPPDNCIQDESDILADCERLISTYHDAAFHSMLRVGLAPCSPFSVSESLMRETAALARHHGVRLHTHLAETQEEDEFCRTHYGARPVDFLERVDWIGEDVWLAHGIWFNDDEIARLGKAGVGICHCPTSNMRLGAGICRVPDLLAAGSPVGLGVDGSASNDTAHALNEARMALYMRRLDSGAEAMTVMQALELATRGGAACLGREELGWLGKGSAADFAAFDLSQEIATSGAHDPVAALLLCGPLRAQTVVVNGRLVVESGRVLSADLPVLLEEHGKAARALVARARPRS